MSLTAKSDSLSPKQDTAAMEISSVADALGWHADHCDRADAPITARIIRAQLALMATDTKSGEMLREWPGKGIEDALALRVTGGLHFFFLTGKAPQMAPIYAGDLTDQAEVDRIVCEVVTANDQQLLSWFEGPPQTNEAGRSSSIMGGLLWLSGKIGPRFDITEIGASAGINSMMARYAYDLGGAKAGPDNSPMLIKPEWRGDAPPQNPVEITQVKACDIAPVDLTDQDQSLRLKAYIWPDAPERMERLNAAIALANAQAPDLVEMDAGKFVKQELARPQEEGTTRLLFHTIMWQYLPKETRDDIRAMLEEKGSQATPEKPFAWMRLETNRETFRHELTVRYWPGGSDKWTLLAEAHPHGAWVEWKGA